MSSNFKKKVSKGKKVFYKKMISDLKKSNPGQWYSKLKRMTAYDQHKYEEIIVNEIRENTDQQQADIIADKFSSVSNIYDPIQKENISFTNSSNCSPQFFTPSTVLPFLRNIKTNKATVKDDISAKLIKEIASYICVPFSDILNTMIIKGEYPDVWKMEVQTPVPKVIPTTTVEQLRNISGLKNLDKIA